MTRIGDWWQRGQSIDVDGDRLFAIDQGSGPTLVFLHGFPTSSHDWAPVIDGLIAHYRCVSVDYLGFGASDKPKDADYSSFRQTDRVLAALARLGIGQATFVGHDLGGIVLQQLLHRVRTASLALRIDRAVFVNSSVYAALYRPTARQLALVDPEQGPALAARIDHAAIEASMAAMFPAHRPAAAVLDDMWAAISRDDGLLLWPRQLVYMAERAAAGAEWEETLRRTATPLAFVYGLADPISGAHILSHAERDLPAARCVGLAGLGHYPQVEAPASFVAALRGVVEG